MRVIALDPGGTTGYAVAEMNGNEIQVGYKQMKWTEFELYTYLLDLEPDHVVYESFQFRQGKARPGINLMPVMLIGVIRMFGQANPDVEVHPQTAAVGKGYFSDEKIKSLGLYQKGKPHGRDALRHLLHWFSFLGGAQFTQSKPTYYKLID